MGEGMENPSCFSTYEKENQYNPFGGQSDNIHQLGLLFVAYIF